MAMFSPGNIRVWIGSSSTSADVTDAFGDIRVTIGATTASLPLLGDTEATLVTLGADTRVTSSAAYYGQGLDLTTLQAIAIFDISSGHGIAMSALPQAREQWGMPAVASQVAVLQVTPEITLNGLMSLVYDVETPTGGTASVTLDSQGDIAWTVSSGSTTKVAPGTPSSSDNTTVSVTTNNYALATAPWGSN